MKVNTKHIYTKNSLKGIIIALLLLMVTFLNSCNDEDLLVRVSKSDLTDASVLNTKAGFEYYLSGLVYYFREEWQIDDNTYWTQFQRTDMYNFVDPEEKPQRQDWRLDYTPESPFAKTYWDWAYIKMIPMANNIIDFADRDENAGIWESEEEKNAMIAQGKFFRAWTYNVLANLFGDVIIIKGRLTEPKFDFYRSPRKEVYELAQEDLEFASLWLPDEVDVSKEGIAIKAAAQHLLTEVCISLEDFEAAISSASDLINNPGFKLMTERFGSSAGELGDVFSDLFKEGNFNRSSGNTESILVWQIEEFIEGGIGSYKRGNNFVRGFAPFLDNFNDPDGKSGWVYNAATNGVDTAGGMQLGRGAGFVRPSNYALYTVWAGFWDDMRNSSYNMKRAFYFNDPASAYFGQKYDAGIHAKTEKDTSRRVYPYSLKVEGPFFEGGDGDFKGRTTKDVYVMRLAETYLLRAEAYLKNNEKDKAAADINEVRKRANAPEIGADDVSLDFILDERARELMAEETRTRTLIRMGNLVERVRMYDPDPASRETVEDHNLFWPIPQSAIDANTGSILRQNDGYND